jgi:plastocyanin
MRKLLVLPLAVLALVVAGVAAGAASKTVTISHTGFSPAAVSINTGDTVVFKNTDTVVHTVAFKSTTGMHCSAAVPLVIAAGKSAGCTFSTAGKFNFSDPTHNKKGFHGTVTVSAPLVSSLTVTPGAVVYGDKSTISGTLASGQSGQSVQVHAVYCGTTKSKLVATVTTTSGGAFTYQAQPPRKTEYTLSNKGATAAATVGVKPSLTLKKVKRHHYLVSVTAATSFSGKVVTFQRFRSKLHRWVKVKRVVLETSTAGTAPTVTTTAKFRSGLKAHQRVRASLGPKQVGACYLAARSKAIRS